ncbi:MAG: ECF transporter S component [Oscillospiraceae bacterium]|jgi:uncharacterized membrane protein|nr:ECF transporter S component [Oscillospiraceae bacterium]
MNKAKTAIGVREIVMVGVFSALVFAASWLSVNIPTPLGNTRIHLGNVLCLLSGFLLGGVRGGLAAGLGSMLFDFTNPLYFSDAGFTFFSKFVMGFLCGVIGFRIRRKDFPHKAVAAIVGQLAYIALYLGKNYYWDALIVQKSSPEAAWADAVLNKAPVSLFNGLLAVVISVPLALTLQRALKGALRNQPEASK